MLGHQGVDARYRDHEWGHELYCAGHNPDRRDR
jgi:hypothetical protein